MTERRSYVTIPLLTETDKAWLAGLIDGEGSINISVAYNKHHKFSKNHYALNLEISLTHLPTLEKVKTLCGVGSLTEHKDKRKHRPYWLWMARSNQALMILELIHPYLVTKKASAEIAIAFQSRRRRNRGHWNRNTPQRESLIAEDEKYYHLLHQINYGLVGSRN